MKGHNSEPCLVADRVPQALFWVRLLLLCQSICQLGINFHFYAGQFQISFFYPFSNVSQPLAVISFHSE